MSGSELGPWPPSVDGFFRKSSQFFTAEVFQVTQRLTSSVTLPSQENLVPSKVAPLSRSGLMPVVRAKVPKWVPSFGAAV